ncbi:MAG: hypothetical protein ACXWC3_29450 [Burkholderiales bacterium]
MREDDREVVETRQRVEKFTDEARRLEALYEARTTQWQSISRALQAVEGWLRNGGIPVGVTLQDHEAEPPKLVKGENLLDAIENRRRRVRELRADLHRIQSAPYPSSYAKQRMREMVEALAMQGAPNVASLIEHDRPIEWARRQVQSEVRGGDRLALGFAEVPDTVALLAWLHRETLIKKLDGEIASESDDAASMSHEARQKAEAEVIGDLLDIERQEAELTWMAQAERLPIEHRDDINPVALLGVRLVTAPRVEVSGTSPEHVVTFAGGRW